MIKDLSSAEYVIIPGKMPFNCNFKETYNEIYEFWERIWAKTFSDSGAPEGTWRDHFIRQNVVVALKSPEEVISVHLYTLYNIEAKSSRDAEYFSYISELSMARLKKSGLTRTMSMEYLASNPDWVHNAQKVSVGRIMAALGAYVGESLGADCTLGMPIKGTSVEKTSASIGGYSIQNGIMKYGYELKLMVMPTNPRPESQDPEAARWSQELWNRRRDLSGLTTDIKTSTAHILKVA